MELIQQIPAFPRVVERDRSAHANFCTLSKHVVCRVNASLACLIEQSSPAYLPFETEIHRSVVSIPGVRRDSLNDVFGFITDDFGWDDDLDPDDFDDDFDEDFEELPDDEFDDFPDPYRDDEYEEIEDDTIPDEEDPYGDDFDDFEADENTFVDEDEEESDD